MLRATLALTLIVSACSIPPPTGLIVYDAVPEHLPGGEIRTRSLMITGAKRVLGIVRSPEGVEVRAGVAPGSDYEDLRTALAAARHLRGDTAPADIETPTFQISVRLGDERVRFVRDPGRHVEKDISSAVTALESIWNVVAPTDDPVGTVGAFLSHDDPFVRGWAAVALLKLRGAEKSPAAVKSAAEAALRAHIAVEKDRSIVNGIRDVIDQKETVEAD